MNEGAAIPPGGPPRPTTSRRRLAPTRRDAFRRRLLDWYRIHARDLPWRRRSDAYAVWLSEIMLQQTQVSVVTPHYERFRDRFPTIEKLAAATEDEVLQAWQGMGYYGRARRLLSAAREIVVRYDGEFPREERAALALPGIGRYTAGAVLSIAYDQPLPVVDGNVARVLIRLEELDGNLDDAATRARLWELAEELVPGDEPGIWNQALMELGALVCQPVSPACVDCPMSALCRARRAGRAAELPPPRRRRPIPRVEVAVGWLAGTSGVAIVRRPDTGVLAGFWELPAVDIVDGATAETRLGRHLRLLGVRDVRVDGALATIEHGMFHRHARMTAYEVRARGMGRLRFVDPLGGDAQPLTTASRKLIAAVLDDAAGTGRRRRAGRP